MGHNAVDRALNALLASSRHFNLDATLLHKAYSLLRLLMDIHPKTPLVIPILQVKRDGGSTGPSNVSKYHTV